MPSTAKPKFKRGFKTFAEKKSIELRAELNVKPSHPLPAVKLADHLAVSILFPHQIPEMDPPTLGCLAKGRDSCWSGVTLRINNKLLVIINDSHSKPRQESSIMHELAHLICNHEMGQFSHLSHGISLRDYDEEMEKEAEWLGACLQLPRIALHYHHKVYGNTVAEIARKFNASNDMVRFRLSVCGFNR
ncbi:MAG TPA: ImmA/IrrE family metallo-endopeptidase [Cyclobacteriaceae bacterium]|nr:ImmA/IrrE family metallo-endopeptidase [Cyclobacteriaceae bacterium]